MRLLDLYCCEGGAARGYQRAGFHVTGVDMTGRFAKRYAGDVFIQGDAIEYLKEHSREYDAIHASPPCQLFTNAQKIRGNPHPDLLTPTRELLDEIGKPYVIENVPLAPLKNPIELCGSMFGLGTYRHRLFESNVPLRAPEHPEHTAPTTKMGRPPRDGEMMHVVGHFSNVEQAKRAMGIDWMTRDGLSESIPPAYTQFIGTQLMEHLGETP